MSDLSHPTGNLARGQTDRSFAPTRPVKRSFSIAGHRTSISLEAAFWDALKAIAASKEQSLASLVAEIDRERGDAGLSGAIRVWILDYYRLQGGQGHGAEGHDLK